MPFANSESFGSSIRKLREERNIPLRKLASLVDLDQSTLSKIERNERKANINLIEKLSKIFQIDVKDLIISYLSDNIVYNLLDEEFGVDALLVAKDKINYFKNNNDFVLEFQELRKMNWDFKNETTNTSTNTIHPYPAKFIPQIPRHFIEKFSKVGETIYDPFIGSGTTAVEANILGRNALGNDINELAILISKVKTTPIDISKFRLIDNLLNHTYKEINKYYKNEKVKIVKPDIINIDAWFKDHVISELIIIKNNINILENEVIKNFCLVALSAIIINVSNQDSDTRYVRVPKKIDKYDTYLRFKRQIEKLKKAFILSNESLKNGYSFLLVADTRDKDVFQENSADLVITSPPYPNAYDYHLYHKYRLLWLDMNPLKLKKNEIGSHADYSKKNGSNEFDFMRDMEKCMFNISKILKKDKYFIIIIGDSILKGRKINNNEIIKEASIKTSFEFVAEYSRNLNLRKKSFNPVIGNIKKEKILVFKNLK